MAVTKDRHKDLLRTCVVCKMQSHRIDWVKKSGNFVACDFHSSDDIAKAVSKVDAATRVKNDAEAKAAADAIAASQGGKASPVAKPLGAPVAPSASTTGPALGQSAFASQAGQPASQTGPETTPKTPTQH